MKILPTPIVDLLILEPPVYGDHRGFFMEIYQKDRYQTSGIDCEFVQDNLSRSVQGTLRGLHYQYPNTQAKLVQVIQGEVFDVAVDIRKGSSDFGKWFGIRLSQDNKRQLFIPEGFAHGFCVMSAEAIFTYKCSDYYSPENEQGILWSDPDIKIAWPVPSPILSEKDKGYPLLKNIPHERLPTYLSPITH
jgi:dTDP-4-dehydrorhamnose 3,5-epimerase